MTDMSVGRNRIVVFIPTIALSTYSDDESRKFCLL